LSCLCVCVNQDGTNCYTYVSKSIYKAYLQLMSIRRLLPYAHSNIQPLSLRLNCFIISVLGRSCESLFCIVGPHTQKLWQPNRADGVRGTTMSPWSADCNCKRAATGVFAQNFADLLGYSKLTFNSMACHRCFIDCAHSHIL